MTILVIVESPAKCQKIEKYLGAGYKVLASFGHLTTLSDIKNIDVANNFTPKFTTIESKSRQIATLQKAINMANKVVIATDDDREGEAIGWHICKLFKLPVETTERIIFHEITETAIKRAIQSPTRLNMNTINAQQGRQILDLIVGFKISPILWNNIVSNSKNALSAGRCQTPALRLVYDNYREIEESPGKTVYKTRGIFTSRNIEFNLNHDFSNKEEVEDFLSESIPHVHELSKMPQKTITKPPPEPFITSTIQQAANNLMHISPKETMQVCQRLYETGYITYMRTDCKVYSKEFLETVKPYIGEKYTAEYIHPNIDGLSERSESTEKPKKPKKPTKSKKSKEDNKEDKESNPPPQEAHEAIRPTNITIEKLPEDEEFSNRERKLYRIIWSNTLESCMADAQFKTFQVKIATPQKHFYQYTTELCIFPGWKQVNGVEESKYFNFLKQIKEGEIKYKKIYSKQSMKDLKSHYTEAKLVQLLEQRGIGRPSTFSALVEKIMERNYVKKENIEGKKLKITDYELEDDEITEIEDEREFGNEKNKLVIKPIGILVIEFLTKNFPEIFDYEYTKTMETDLDEIAKGNSVYHELCRNVYDSIENTIQEKELNKNNKINIKIDENHTYIVGKNGPVIKCIIDKVTTFKSLNPDLIKNIDLEALKNNEYKLEDLVDVNVAKPKNELGLYKGEKVYLKTGKYGNYIEWGKNKKSMNAIDKTIDQIILEDAVNIIENRIKTVSKSLVREIDNNLSIRNGKYGDYIFYKTEKI